MMAGMLSGAVSPVDQLLVVLLLVGLLRLHLRIIVVLFLDLHVVGDGCRLLSMQGMMERSLRGPHYRLGKMEMQPSSHTSCGGQNTVGTDVPTYDCLYDARILTVIATQWMWLLRCDSDRAPAKGDGGRDRDGQWSAKGAGGGVFSLVYRDDASMPLQFRVFDNPTVDVLVGRKVWRDWMAIEMSCLHKLAEEIRLGCYPLRCRRIYLMICW